ncbi:hypothetical protein DHW03_17130 [Pedobacter yonginense]|uniref:DNA-binding response regulator n=1 Tax=Pedobacter yonginense TaxID=651869 RepID=A0A317EI61_9SPHI|nr:LytTR family DNA-binding domain-containing protein [Pedobacter yonginense]PWS26501.1 hypothetical protein DHW03_17130 [Pedobacter yonginense]
MTFSCIVIDDDLVAVEQLEEFILKIPMLTLKKSYTNALLALTDIQALKEPIDFLFTDIEMPELTGFELAKQVSTKIKKLVLVSGYMNYAVDGYPINARAFLHKPFDFKKFERVVFRLINEFKSENPYVFIKSGKHSIVKMHLKDVIAVEGNGNYINIYTLDETLSIHYKLSDIEQELKPFKIFERVSKSYIISTVHIVNKKGNKILLKNGLEVLISESYREALKLEL